MDPRTQEVDDLCEEIRPLLAGREPEIIGAVLGDLVALWLVAHQGPADEIEAYREGLLQVFVEMVRGLMPINEKLLRETIKQMRQQ
jgi:hypothetical protein